MKENIGNGIWQTVSPEMPDGPMPVRSLQGGTSFMDTTRSVLIVCGGGDGVSIPNTDMWELSFGVEVTEAGSIIKIK
jgi:hypothetical protein